MSTVVALRPCAAVETGSRPAADSAQVPHSSAIDVIAVYAITVGFV